MDDIRAWIDGEIERLGNEENGEGIDMKQEVVPEILRDALGKGTQCGLI